MIAAAAATTRSRLSICAVPKSRLADRSIASQVSSSRSATVCRTCGTVVRAVTGQSIRRTSSPGRYSRDSPASLPGPGQQAEVVALQQPVELAGDRAAAAGRAPRSARAVATPPAGGRAGRAGRSGRPAGRAGAAARADGPAGGPARRRRSARRGGCCPAAGVAFCRGRDRRHRHGGQHPGDDVVGRDVVGERVVAEHQPVPQDVRRDVLHVLRQRVVAAAQQGQRPGGADDAERGARAGAVLDQLRDVGHAVLGRGAGGQHQPDRVVDQRVVHEHLSALACRAIRSAGVKHRGRLAAGLTPIR